MLRTRSNYLLVQIKYAKELVFQVYKFEIPDILIEIQVFASKH